MADPIIWSKLIDKLLHKIGPLKAHGIALQGLKCERPVAQGAVRSFRVVLPAPATVDDDLGFLQAVEDLLV